MRKSAGEDPEMTEKGKLKRTPEIHASKPFLYAMFPGTSVAGGLYVKD